MTHYTSASCKGEKCSICKASATHKVGEEILHDDPNPTRHNLTACVCCEHYRQILGPSSCLGINANVVMAMTRGALLKFLTNEAKKYRKIVFESITRNNHMNNLTQKDLLELATKKKLMQKFAEALLVDFLNHVAVVQGIDLGLYTKHLKEK